MEGLEKKRQEGVESGDQDVGREFLVKVFPNERIIMQRSLSLSASSHKPSLPSFLSVFHCRSFFTSHLFFFFSPFSLCFSGLTLVPTSLKPVARCLPPHFCNLVYFLPHSCFLYLSCFSSFPLFAPLTPPQFPKFFQALGSLLL